LLDRVDKYETFKNHVCDSTFTLRVHCLVDCGGVTNQFQLLVWSEYSLF
jgi:hypothetical protein